MSHIISKLMRIGSFPIGGLPVRRTAGARWRGARSRVARIAAVAGLAVFAGWCAAQPAIGAVTGAGAGRPGSLLWASRYAGPGHSEDFAAAASVSPDGRTLYVTGLSFGTSEPNGRDFVTIAFNTVTGAQRWVSRYDFGDNDSADSLAVSRDGRTVYVTGTSVGASTGQDYATIAYNAATGAQRWVSRYNDPANGPDDGTVVAVGPAGRTVYVTGSSQQPSTGWDYLTVAYDAATGAQRWASRYNGPASKTDHARSLVVSPGGGTVYVTGGSAGHSADYATVAYNAATGAQRWASRYDGPARRTDTPGSVAVSPHGDMVFVTGQSMGAASGYDFATIAYNAATGAQQWVRRYNGKHNGADLRTTLAVSPAGGTVFVLGTSTGATTSRDYATVAYNAATGARRWVSRFNSNATCNDYSSAIAVSPDASTVFVTGNGAGHSCRSDTATVAYNAATGRPAWTNRGHVGRAFGTLAVSPDSKILFAAGGTHADLIAVAYRT